MPWQRTWRNGIVFALHVCRYHSGEEGGGFAVLSDAGKAGYEWTTQ
jgi:hypothetical protein